ncbi:MAG TPA: hypothetical protein VM658_09925 [bacterium]|nr:hypothetical protein [bacterium]
MIDSIPVSPGDDGVDVGLIRWMLSLSPRERLQVLQQNVNSLLKLRHAKDGN